MFESQALFKLAKGGASALSAASVIMAMAIGDTATQGISWLGLFALIVCVV